MNTHKHYDVIVIGTGAGGGTLVHSLASTGKSILILERGDSLLGLSERGCRAADLRNEFV